MTLKNHLIWEGSVALGLWGICIWIRPGMFSYYALPFLFIFAWFTIYGPHLKKQVRHPDINAILHLPITHKLLYRPLWAAALDFPLRPLVLLIFLLGPGAILGFFLNPNMDFNQVFLQMIWWATVGGASILSFGYFIEILILQTIAIPIVGGLMDLIFLLGVYQISSVKGYGAWGVVAAISMVIFSLYVTDLARRMRRG
ncbi:MAG: hypothetical protein WCW30_00785 [Candidatus Gracilibacteria bacterium]